VVAKESLFQSSNQKIIENFKDSTTKMKVILTNTESRAPQLNRLAKDYFLPMNFPYLTRAGKTRVRFVRQKR
jgi:hypothetical protein